MEEGKNTKFCVNCGAKIDSQSEICPKCGTRQPFIPEKVSSWWYILPIFFGLIGGLIAWIVNKEHDLKKARNFLIVGIVISLTWMMLSVIFILVPLNKARERARDYSVIANMDQIRIIAEMISLDEEGFSTVNCAHPELLSLCQDIKSWVGEEPTIYSTQEEYCAYVKLPSGIYYCIDSKGVGEKTSVYPGGAGYCDGKTFSCP